MMKKYVSIALALICALCMLTLGVSAAAENKLKTSWDKGLAQAVEQKVDEDGVPYASATGIDKAWISPFLNVYDAVKAVIGSEDEAEVMFVYEVRVQYKNEADKGTPITVEPAIRANELNPQIKDKDTFAGLYEGSLFRNPDTNVMAFFQDVKSLELTDEWTVFEASLYVEKGDINDDFWKRWDLCVHQISDPDLIASLEFRNAGVYDAEEYESVFPTPTPDLATPVPATPEPTPTVAPNTPAGAVSTTAPATGTTPGMNDGDAAAGNTTTIIIICVVAAVVVAAVIVGVVVVKKKKGDSDVEPTDGDNK